MMADDKGQLAGNIVSQAVSFLYKHPRFRTLFCKRFQKPL
ncbi:hypothetical protein B4113_2794 [Geobacillus sp. B4113_201601]|nr:hypothetical protein B4113_2794 [Geobacillus sp. B4113_201601]